MGEAPWYHWNAGAAQRKPVVAEASSSRSALPHGRVSPTTSTWGLAPSIGTGTGCDREVQVETPLQVTSTEIQWSPGARVPGRSKLAPVAPVNCAPPSNHWNSAPPAQIA